MYGFIHSFIHIYIYVSLTLQEANVDTGDDAINSTLLADATFYFNGETFNCNTLSGPPIMFIKTLSGATLLG